MTYVGNMPITRHEGKVSEMNEVIFHLDVNLTPNEELLDIKLYQRKIMLNFVWIDFGYQKKNKQNEKFDFLPS